MPRTPSTIKLLPALFLALVAGAFTTSALADGLDNVKPKTPRQKAILKALGHWRDTYNGPDPEFFIKETYAADADVMFTGASAHGYDQFIKLEKAILAGAPGRKMRVDRVDFIGNDTALVEAVNLDSARPDFYTPWCAILLFNKDNKIVLDRTYLHPERWPGIDGVKDLVTPGGLGAPDQVTASSRKK